MNKKLKSGRLLSKMSRAVEHVMTSEEKEKLAEFGAGVLDILENVYDDVLEEIENLAIKQGMIRFESIHPSLIDVAKFYPNK